MLLLCLHLQARTTGAAPSVRLVTPASSVKPTQRGSVQLCRAIELSDAFKAALSTALE